MNQGSAVATANVCMAYGTKRVLSGLSLSVPRGAAYALLGHNGAGKSTLLKVICNILPHDSGQVEVLGYKVPQQHQLVKRHVAYLPDHPPLYDQLSPLEHFEYDAALWQIPQRAVRERAEEYLHRFKLWQDRNTWVERFSRGMRQKVALIRVLIRQAELLILDEPLDGIDYDSMQAAVAVLQEFQTNGTLLFTSHNQDFISLLADHMAVLAMGTLVYQGPVPVGGIVSLMAPLGGGENT